MPRLESRERRTRGRKHKVTGWWPQIPSAGRERDTCGEMPEESTTPDLVELTRRAFEAFDRLDNGTLEPLLNDAAAASYYGFPTRDDVRRFRARGRRFW